MSLLDDIAADIAGTDAFYDIDSGFAETVTGPSGTFPVIFDLEGTDIELGGEVVLNGNDLTATCRSADAPAVGQNIQIRSVTYEVINTIPNEDNEIILILHENPAGAVYTLDSVFFTLDDTTITIDSV